MAYPTADWTWDDFRAAAKRLTDPSTKQFGWAYVNDASEDTVWRFDALLWQAGGDILTPDQKHAAFNSPAGVEAATLLQQMATVDHSVYLDNGNGNYANLFNSGKIGMLFTGPWDLSGFPDVDYGIQILPGDQNHQTISGPDQWVMLDNGDDRRNAAWTFLKWFTSPTRRCSGRSPPATCRSARRRPRRPTTRSTRPSTRASATFVENEQNALKARPGAPDLQRDLPGDGAGDPGHPARARPSPSRPSTRRRSRSTRSSRRAGRDPNARSARTTWRAGCSSCPPWS